MIDLVISFIGGFSAGTVITFLFCRKVTEKATAEIILGAEKLGIITVNEEVLADKLNEYGSMKELTKHIIKEASEDG